MQRPTGRISQGGGLYLHPAGETASLNADAAMDLPEAAARLTAMRCFARFASSSNDYPYDCDVHLPLPYPALTAAALETALAPSPAGQPLQLPETRAGQTGHRAPSDVSLAELQADKELLQGALCYAAAAAKLSENDAAAWHTDTTSAVLIMASVRLLATCTAGLPCRWRGAVHMRLPDNSKIRQQCSASAENPMRAESFSGSYVVHTR